MVTDTTQDAQIRRTILKRIVYEVRCEEMGIRPDGWKLYPED
jgi:myo-inositol catabolism protein IolC